MREGVERVPCFPREADGRHVEKQGSWLVALKTSVMKAAFESEETLVIDKLKNEDEANISMNNTSVFHKSEAVSFYSVSVHVTSIY